MFSLGNGGPLLAFVGVGTTQLIILGLVVLLLFGSRLPSAMRALGSSVNSFKKGMKEGEEEDNDRLESRDDL